LFLRGTAVETEKRRTTCQMWLGRNLSITGAGRWTVKRETDSEWSELVQPFSMEKLKRWPDINRVFTIK
jgi:hypothetical protein